MWSQPPMCSTSLLHWGHGFTLSLALHSRMLLTGSPLVAASRTSAASPTRRACSQVRPSCQVSRQSKQNLVPHPSRSHVTVLHSSLMGGAALIVRAGSSPSSGEEGLQSSMPAHTALPQPGAGQ